MSRGLVGFFGKLPSHGDFVGRRLPPEVKDCFDRWLQAGLVRSKEDLGDEWLPVWLSSPIWRFVVAAGVCGEQAWAGVMMPSHDRVGRCFPLLLMAGIDGTPSVVECMTVAVSWFDQLEHLALSTLNEDFSLIAFDAALTAAPIYGPIHRSALKQSPISETKAKIFPALAYESLERKSAWWTEGSEKVPRCLAIWCGLPSSDAFSALLNGRWSEHGWKNFDFM